MGGQISSWFSSAFFSRRLPPGQPPNVGDVLTLPTEADSQPASRPLMHDLTPCAAAAAPTADARDDGGGEWLHTADFIL